MRASLGILLPVLLIMTMSCTAASVEPRQTMPDKTASAKISTTGIAATPAPHPSNTKTTQIEQAAPAGAETPRSEQVEEIDWLTVEGKTGDNFTYLGNPDAPVTIIDYSDFL